jgi:hypothetical protein
VVSVPLPEEMNPQPTLVTLLHDGNIIQDRTWTAGQRREVRRIRTVHVIEFEPVDGLPDEVTVPMGTRIGALGARRRLRPVAVPLPGEDPGLDLLEDSWAQADLRTDERGHG